MSRSTLPRGTWIARALGVAAVFAVLALLLIPPASVSVSGSRSGDAVSGSAHLISTSAQSGPGAAAAVPRATLPTANGSNGFNPYCHPIYTSIYNSVCVSIANSTETDIVPAAGATVCSSRPNSTATLPLIVKARQPLNWTGAVPRFGPHSPIALNVTGTLWNGDPYYNQTDYSIWHSNSNVWWTGPTRSSNSSYPWWYGVELTAHAQNGGPNFFPGMTIDWWIYLTFFNNNTYSHPLNHPVFECTYSGAWPYSPYPGSKQYAGSSAVSQDVNLTVTPQSPNWNDSVSMVLNTTQADGELGINATIGKAWVDVIERAANGSLILNGTVPFPVIVNGGTGYGNGIGQVTTTAVIPARYAQFANATVTYQITVFDTAYDQLVTPWAMYVVGGNGSFASGVFTDDMVLTALPETVLSAPYGTAVVNPGQPVNVTIVSRVPSTSIYAAQISYTVTYPTLHETVSGFVTLVRERSTLYTGALPGLPLGTNVTFSVFAWDFNQRLEVSPTYVYSTPVFGVIVPIVPLNSTFFYIYVYDNGSHQWVNGAKVQVTGPHGFFNSVSNATLGVAYPNQTGAPYTPLLVPANASYKIIVNDPYFVPPGQKSAPSLSFAPNATVLALNPMANRGTLVQTDTYLVVQEADSIYFYLNSTPPLPPVSPPAYTAVTVSMTIGIVAAVGVAFPLMGWWGQIRARRKEEEKRVTL